MSLTQLSHVKNLRTIEYNCLIFFTYTSHVQYTITECLSLNSNSALGIDISRIKMLFTHNNKKTFFTNSIRHFSRKQKKVVIIITAHKTKQETSKVTKAKCVVDYFLYTRLWKKWQNMTNLSLYDFENQPFTRLYQNQKSNIWQVCLLNALFDFDRIEKQRVRFYRLDFIYIHLEMSSSKKQNSRIKNNFQYIAHRLQKPSISTWLEF